MIVSLEGDIFAIEDTLISISTLGGVGYGVTVSPHFVDMVKAAHEKDGYCKSSVRIQHIFRDDGQRLYGFRNGYTEEAFVRMIAIKGVGPAVAMKVIGKDKNMDWYQDALITSDLNPFKEIAGIGQKMAEKLITELRPLYFPE